jgi:predicted aspartyl protease
MAELTLIIEPDQDEPSFASVYVDGTIAGRRYRFILDTGAARTRLPRDEYTATLPSAGTDSSAGAFGVETRDPLVTVTDLTAGPLRAARLDVGLTGNGPNLLGMDVLGEHRCVFRCDAGLLAVDEPARTEASLDLLVGERGHPYVDLCWPGATARAVWDTGAGPTLVNRDFWLAHPDLFEEAGSASGTDSTRTQMETPLLRMAGPVIGGRQFDTHLVVAVDLSAANSALDHPMDLIVGYPTIRQTDWLFDFPARRWDII